MSCESVAWDGFAWRAGAENYKFAIQDGGRIGVVSVLDGRTFALPMVVWEAMFDAIKTNRKSKAKLDANAPARFGARWSEKESDELAAKFRSGRSIDDLAREHARTVWSIEGQLAKMGLRDRIERRRVSVIARVN